MGLDMYLTASRLYAPYEWCSEEEREGYKKIVELADAKDYVDDEFTRASIEVGVGTWRKANAIHQWFVDNCQKGEDDCRITHVMRESLEELKELCESVLANPETADEELPTQSGFFFGSQEYDEWYFSDVRKTVQIIDKALAMPNKWDFYYTSSW